MTMEADSIMLLFSVVYGWKKDHEYIEAELKERVSL